ncbi:MAG: hypothetical protein ABEJ03_05690 [Candidatus Nanohaloarchaea archaeon]
MELYSEDLENVGEFLLGNDPKFSDLDVRKNGFTSSESYSELRGLEGESGEVTYKLQKTDPEMDSTIHPVKVVAKIETGDYEIEATYDLGELARDIRPE